MTSAADRYAAAYGRAAAAYAEVLDPTLEPVARRIVQLGRIGKGTRVLDLASGTGAVARAAAEAGGTVVGIDVSPAMVELAQRSSPSSVRFVTADAAALPFEDGAFDAVTCGFGLSHMLDIQAVLREVRRVLAPVGVFVESSWGADGNNPAFAAVLDELAAAAEGDIHFFGEILDDAAWADAARGTALLAAADFAAEASTERLEGRYATPQQALDWALAWPDFGETAAQLPPPVRDRFRASALSRCAAVPLAWWFEINYFVGEKHAR